VAEGRWDDFVSFLRKAIPFYEEPGGIRVRLLRDVEDADVFIEVIEYETEASYAADQHRVGSDLAMIARLEEWRGLLAGPVDVQTLREIVAVMDSAPVAKAVESRADQASPGHPGTARPTPAIRDLKSRRGGTLAAPGEPGQAADSAR
jgi:hypothetical protein